MDNILDLYEVIKVYKFEEWEERFLERYVDLYAKYDYIVGDISANVLRLTGFYKDTYEKDVKYHLQYHLAYDAPYFILKLKEENNG